MTKEIPQDQKISTREKNIAYFNCANRATEFVLKEFKGQAQQNGIKEWIDIFYQQWVEWYNESQNRSQLRLCPDCNGNVIMKKRKSDGNPFWGCSNYPSCKFTENISEEKEEKVNTDLPAEERIVNVGETPLPKV